MTILFATDHYSPHVNGVVRQVMMLRQELLRRGHRVLVLTARIGEITNKEPDIFYLPSFKTYTHADDYFTMPFNKKVEEKIIAIHPDIVHSHLFFTGFMATKIAKKINIPAVVTNHTFIRQYFDWVIPYAKPFTHPFASSITRRYFNMFDIALAPSLKAVDDLENAHVTTTIRHLPNAIDQRLAKQTSAKTFRDKWHVDPQQPLLILVGNLEKGKNVDVAIRTMSYVVQKYPMAQMALIGDGNRRPILTQLILKLRLQNNIFITGFVDPLMVASANHAADIALFTSDTDNFPTVLIEALTAHKPIVAVDDKAVIDLVHSGINGSLAPKDPKILAEEICLLLSDKTKLRRYGAESGKLAKQFTIDDYVDNLEEIYRSLIAQKR